MKPELEEILQHYGIKDETLQHYGVKGMRWGVHRARDEINSLNRERRWKKVFDNIDDYSNEEIIKISKRIQLENEQKKLVRSRKLGSKKDKHEYRRRADLTNEELTKVVERLRAKDALHKQIQEASKEQKEFGRKVANIGAPVAVKYLKSAVTRQPVKPMQILNDVWNVGVKIKNPKYKPNKDKNESLEDAAWEAIGIAKNVTVSQWNKARKKRKQTP